MDPISSSAIQPSIQAVAKPENAEADMTVNKFGNMVSKFDSGSELREIANQDKLDQAGTTVADNGLGGTFDADA